MPNEQFLIGVAVAMLSAFAAWKTDWLVRNTRKGQWFARRFGESRARMSIASFFILAALFGLLLATNVIRPLQW